MISDGSRFENEFEHLLLDVEYFTNININTNSNTNSKF